MAQNTLLICYDFPPNQGIGGRRWAKMAKALAKLDTEIHVIKADPKSNNTSSPWQADVGLPNIHVHSLKRTYPEILSDPGSGILDKIRYRLERFQMRRKVKGTIYDLSIDWHKLMLPKAFELIHDHKIKNLIVTGAPFNLFDYAAEIKRSVPELRLLLDYRDPWLTAVNYGIPQLDYKNFLHEKLKQRRALEVADLVTCPNPFMLEEIRHSDDELPIGGEYMEIPHFYDEDDIAQYLEHDAKGDEKIRIVYGGTLYMGLEPHFRSMCSALDALKKDNPGLYSKLEIELYTKDHQFASWFTGYENVVKLSRPIGKQLFERIAQADACFIFLAHHNKNYRTTKFFEILPFQKPLIFMGDEGYVSEFIESEKLGAVLRDPKSEFIGILERLDNGDLEGRRDFDHQAYSLMNVAKKVEDKLL